MNNLLHKCHQTPFNRAFLSQECNKPPLLIMEHALVERQIIVNWSKNLSHTFPFYNIYMAVHTKVNKEWFWIKRHGNGFIQFSDHIYGKWYNNCLFLLNANLSHFLHILTSLKTRLLSRHLRLFSLMLWRSIWSLQNVIFFKLPTL